MKLSIIVPVYNSEKYLKKCLDSLINEKMREIEFILINDGSTDNCEKIIKSYKDPRIRYFKQKNLGVSIARNRGIKEAKGEYIGFLDSDDYIENNTYSIMYNYAILNDLDVVVCDYFEENNNKTNIINLLDFKITCLNDSPNILMDIPLGPCNKIYKKEIFDDNSFFPVNLKYEDTPFVAHMFKNAKKIGKLNKSLYHYVIHSGSETTIVDKRVFDIFKISDILLADLGDNMNIKSSLEDLIIYLITKYTISMRYIKDKKIRNDFIAEAFNYLENNIQNYKKSNYFKNRFIFKKIIEQNKVMTKLYCLLYINVKKC